MKKKTNTPNITNPECYTFYDRKREICWILQPAICEQNASNTGLSEKSLDHIRNNLNSWQDNGVKTYIVDDLPLGDYMLGENLTEFTEKSIAFAVRMELDRYETFAFRDNPCSYLFDSKDNLYDDVEIIGTISFSPCTNKGNYNIDYGIVNEKYRGKGLGGRMIKSFMDNPDFFTYSRQINTVFTSVRNDNSRCQQMLKNLGFSTLSPCHERLPLDPKRKVYRTYKKVLNEEMENY